MLAGRGGPEGSVLVRLESQAGPIAQRGSAVTGSQTRLDSLLGGRKG